LASVTVMPLTPTSWSASFTSSSLNGLMIASIFFTREFPRQPVAILVPCHLRCSKRAKAELRGFSVLKVTSLRDLQALSGALPEKRADRRACERKGVSLPSKT
jgi:hypothetical protein